MNLREIGEFGFIDRIKKGCLIRDKNVVKGIGDDCCVFRSSSNLVTLLTTDMLVENIHFLRQAMPPEKLGRKAMAVNISDIAAMGGIPREAVISIAVPDTIEVEYLDSLYDGMKSMATEFEVNLLGGNTTSSQEHLIINIALIGEEPEDEVLYRSGALVGDIIFLTGAVGTSAAGLDILLVKREFECAGELLEVHFNPRPHVKEGRIIAGLKAAHSLIDVSDGVASDLGHICYESKVGAVIEEEKIPSTENFRNYCEKFRLDIEDLTLHIGEDYVLLGTVPESRAKELGKALADAGCAFFEIGRIVHDAGIRLRGRDGRVRKIASAGYDHFRR
jgi:thiamine-monophosphate kinase